MKITEILATIRTPTIQYGYMEHAYKIQIDEDEESIENVLRHIHKEHRQALREVENDTLGYPISDEPPWDEDSPDLPEGL